jgi:hypothetical protein
MNGQWSSSGPPQPFGMFMPNMPGGVQSPPSPHFMQGGMVMPHSPGLRYPLSHGKASRESPGKPSMYVGRL